MKKDKLKKIQWFPEAKNSTHEAYLVMIIFMIVPLIMTFIIFLCLIKDQIVWFFVILIFLFIVFSLADRKIYPKFIKADKGFIKIYYWFFNHKKMKCSEVKISYTNLLDVYGERARNDTIVVKKHSFPPKIFSVFVLYTEKKFVDKYYLTKSLKTIEELQRYADYSWPTVLEKEFIVIDGTYKNYKYLRQFFDVDKFRDTRGIEEDKIAEFETTLQQEKIAK